MYRDLLPNAGMLVADKGVSENAMQFDVQTMDCGQIRRPFYTLIGQCFCIEYMQRWRWIWRCFSRDKVRNKHAASLSDPCAQPVTPLVDHRNCQD